MAWESRVVLAVHGGAWAIPNSLAEASRQGVREAATRGYRVLCRQGSATDAVVEAVTSLENDPAFDAGKMRKMIIKLSGVSLGNFMYLIIILSTLTN